MMKYHQPFLKLPGVSKLNDSAIKKETKRPNTVFSKKKESRKTTTDLLLLVIFLITPIDGLS